MSTKSWYLSLILLLSFYGTGISVLTAQAEQPAIRWGLESGPFMSFAGLNFNLVATASLGKHEVYLGPKWVLSDLYLIERGPWGIDLGYRMNLAHTKKVHGFFNLEYQTAFLRPAGNGLKTIIHEYHGGYGFRWKLSEQWQLGNSIGLGGIHKQSKVAGTEETFGLSGFSFLLKIFVKYQFGKSND